MVIKFFRRLKTRTKVLLAFGFVLIFIVFVHLISLSTLQNFKNVQHWISRTHVIIAELEELERLVTEYESNVRGYVISKEESFSPRRNIHDSALKHLKYIRSLTANNRAQQDKIIVLEKVLIEKLDFTTLILTTLHSDGNEKAESLISTSKGRILMMRVKRQLAQIKAEENILLKQGLADAERRYNKALFTSSFSRIIGLIILALLATIIVRDIERQQKLKDQLKESESTLKQYFDALPFAITVVDTDGRLRYVNEIAATSFTINNSNEGELTISDLTNKIKIYKAGTDSEYPSDELPLYRALNGESVYTDDIEIELQKERMPVAISAKPIFNNKHEVEYAIAVTIDISERRNYEKSLKMAIEAAEKSASTRERFLANMSHEIRTPMNAIIGFAGLLSNTALKEEQEEYVRAIRSAGDNLLTIINDILDVSKIEAGMLSIEEVPFSIHSLLDSIRVLLQQKAKEKGLQLIMTDDNAIPEYLVGDPVRITQILINLIGNAIKFTERGTVSINVKFGGAEADESIIVFEIKDTGIGIPKDKLNEIFNRFSQGSSDTTRKFGGTGLGLSIVQSLVNIMKGKIEVESELEKGTCFRVMLPFKKPDKVELSLLKSESISEEAGIQGLHILIVEDNILNQRLAEKLLEKMGHTTEIAINGLIATELVRTGSKFDLILMDIQMPEMDGYEAASVIRNILRSDIPIIAMTAHAMRGEKEKCLEIGMNDYIPKPIKVKELQTKINRLASGINNKEGEKIMSQGINGSDRLCNFSHLEELADGNSDFIVEMLQLYLKHAPTDISGIEKAIQEKNIQEAGRLAHKMKSSSTILGNSQFTENLKELEITCLDNGSFNNIQRLFTVILDLHKKTMHELMAKLDGLNAA